jgi:Flp pilus assembly pilin Flp
MGLSIISSQGTPLTLLARFRKDERGATFVEIGLVACLSVIAILTAYGTLMGG